MAASLVSEQQVKYDPVSRILVGEYEVSFTDKPNKTYKKVIRKVDPGTEGAMLTRHGAILVDSLNMSIASVGTQEIENSDDANRWSDLPDDDNKRALAQTSVRQAADYTHDVERLMSNRGTRADAASPAARSYELLKKVFPEILTWGWSGAQIDEYLNITPAERNELSALWTFQDTNRQVMVDLQDYVDQLPVTSVDSPVEVSGASSKKGKKEKKPSKEKTLSQGKSR